MDKINFIMRASFTHEGEATPLDLNKLDRRKDGAVLFNVNAMRDGDYEYRAYELPGRIADELGARGFDDKLVGRIEKPEMRKTLGQFEALPVTDEHIFINARNKEDIVGHVLRKGKINNEGFVETRLVVESSDLLSEIESGKKTEVSIGFTANLPKANKSRGQDGEPDFFITGIELNHLAVIERGRAGREARLLNHDPVFVHGLKLDFDNCEGKTLKIKINNVDYDLPEDAVHAISAERETNQGVLTKSEDTLKAVNSDMAKLTGENAALKAQIENAESPEKAASKLLAEHTDTVAKLAKLGDKTELKFGEYDKTDALRKALTNFGVKGLDKADFAHLSAVYEGVAATIQTKTGAGSLESAHSQPVQMGGFGQKTDRGASRVMGLVHEHNFNSKVKKEG